MLHEVNDAQNYLQTVVLNVYYRHYSQKTGRIGRCVKNVCKVFCILIESRKKNTKKHIFGEVKILTYFSNKKTVEDISEALCNRNILVLAYVIE